MRAKKNAVRGNAGLALRRCGRAEKKNTSAANGTSPAEPPPKKPGKMQGDSEVAHRPEAGTGAMGAAKRRQH
jgi:hypothetical protein